MFTSQKQGHFTNPSIGLQTRSTNLKKKSDISLSRRVVSIRVHSSFHAAESGAQPNFDRNRAFGLNGAKVRMQVRTPIRSKKQIEIHPQTLQNQAKVG